MKAETSANSERPRGLRWWPAALLVAALVGRIVWAWTVAGEERQIRVMRTGKAVVVGIALLVLWWLFFSRVRWRTRWVGLGLAVALLVGAGVVFRFKGVTGDLVPLFEPRWRARPTASAPAAGTTEANGTNASAALMARGAFPQFLGADRDGEIRGVRLSSNWTARPPQLLWRRPVGDGWGGFAVAGALALTQEQDGSKERVIACDLGTGRTVWAHEDEARYDNPVGGIGPRATPTIVGDRVYAIGATGWLNCLDLATGRRWWGTNVSGGAAVKDLDWGVSSSPLVLTNLGVVVVGPHGVPGRALAAYRTGDGASAWVSDTSPAHYSSPRLETLLGVPQILLFTSAGAAGHDPVGGVQLWNHPWRGGHPHVTDPRAVGTNRVLVSSGYGTGSQLIELARDADGKWAAPKIVWRSMRLKSKFANLLLRDGFVYGLDDGKLVCLDLADGSQRWEGERYGHGQLLLVGNLILLTAESGEIVLVEAVPDAFRERARFPAVEGKTWNPPALAGDILVVRNDREAAAYRLALEP